MLSSSYAFFRPFAYILTYTCGISLASSIIIPFYRCECSEKFNGFPIGTELLMLEPWCDSQTVWWQGSCSFHFITLSHNWMWYSNGLISKMGILKFTSYILFIKRDCNSFFIGHNMLFISLIVNKNLPEVYVIPPLHLCLSFIILKVMYKTFILSLLDFSSFFHILFY